MNSFEGKKEVDRIHGMMRRSSSLFLKTPRNYSPPQGLSVHGHGHGVLESAGLRICPLFFARHFMMSGIRDHTEKNQENAGKGTYSEPKAG